MSLVAMLIWNIKTRAVAPGVRPFRSAQGLRPENLLGAGDAGSFRASRSGSKNLRALPSPALAQTDFVGIAVHCADGGGICNHNVANSRTDSLPDEQGGYGGFKALFGAKYVDPAINHGASFVNDTNEWKQWPASSAFPCSIFSSKQSQQRRGSGMRRC